MQLPSSILVTSVEAGHPVVSNHELVGVVTSGYHLAVIVKTGYQAVEPEWKDCLWMADESSEYLVGEDVRTDYQLVWASYYRVQKEGCLGLHYPPDHSNK
jgi:hypothetical protein